MARRLVLHVGLMKSGTSYVQARLLENRQLLARHGVLYPSPWRRQVSAVKQVIGRERPDFGPSRGWGRLVDELAGHTGVGLLSMEFLGTASPEEIRRVVDDVRAGGMPTPEVVLTVRDLGRCVPAMWQEHLKSGGATEWADYLVAIEIKQGRPGRSFWRQQGAARVARNWASVVGAENVTVVTVPPAGNSPDLLWERFGAAARLDLPEAAAAPAANQSLGVASCLLLREVNERVKAADVDWEWRGVIKRRLAKQVLARHRDQEEPIGFEVPAWLHERARVQRERLEASGVRVVGDLDDLTPRSVAGADPGAVSLAQRHEASMWALGELLVTALRQEAERVDGADPEQTDHDV